MQPQEEKATTETATELVTLTLRAIRELETEVAATATRLQDLRSMFQSLIATPTETTTSTKTQTDNGRVNQPTPDPWELDKAVREAREELEDRVVQSGKAVREAEAARKLRAEYLAAVRRRRARLQRDLDRARALYPFEIIL